MEVSPTDVSPGSIAWKELNVDTNDMDPITVSLPRISVSPNSRTRTAKMTGIAEFKSEKSSDATKSISVNGKLLDPSNYFGNNARKEFFNNYQEMSKNRLIYSGHERSIEKSIQSKGAQKLNLSRSLPSLTDPSKAQSQDQMRAIWGDNDAFEEFDEEKLKKSTKNFYGHYSNSSEKVMNSSLNKSLGSLLLADDDCADDPSATEEFSPRTKYIGACIREHITPLPKLVLRKDEKTTALNLSHFGIHDQMGKILAECLDDLPYVESIDISGNSLTDNSLPLLFKSFEKIPNLKHLNLSRSKIDDETSAALAKFIANPDCPLNSLVMQNADVDDFELARFMLCLKTNQKLRELDLSSNLLGSAEIFQGAKSDSFRAGGKAIAEFISSSDCRLSTLKLAWNSIKMSSSIDIAKALSINHTLMYLDLSYNGLSQVAGEYIGDSLQSNTTIHTLLLGSNQLNGVAIFCICVGLQNNSSLRKISLDKNPIGEFGAKAIIQVPEYVGQRCNLSAVGCNIKLRETNNLGFKFDSLVRDWTFNLEKPFERTVSRWLLEKVAGHNSLIVTKVIYEASNGKQTPVTLNLVSVSDDITYANMDENHRSLVDSFRKLLVACQDVDRAEQVFLEADLDRNDRLDKDEMALCLEDLGYPMEPETVDDIFIEFDVDYSGFLEREEFFGFLASKEEETKCRLAELFESFYYATPTAPNEVYLPPKTGILHFTVVNNFTDKSSADKSSGPKNVVTSIQQKYAFEQAVKTGDSNLISEFIQHTRLRYNEALKVYKAINAEIGNMATALSKVLVRMLNTNDARMLLQKVTGNDAMKMLRVKQALGNSHQPLLGNMNGFYSLNLSVENDRLCLILLLEHSKTWNSNKQRDCSFGAYDGKLGDTSQHGNWTCFRNEIFNGEKFEITSNAFIPMKTTGILEFDYSSVERPTIDACPINDFRLCRILNHITLIPSNDLYKALSILGELKDMTVWAEQHFANCIYETTLEKAKLIGSSQEIAYNNLVTRGVELQAALKKEIVMTDLKAEKNFERKFSKAIMKSSNSFNNRSFRGKRMSSGNLTMISPKSVPPMIMPSLRSEDSDGIILSVSARFGLNDNKDDSSQRSFEEETERSARLTRLKSIRRLPSESFDFKEGLDAKDEEDLPPHITEIKLRFQDLLVNASVTANAKAYRILEVFQDLFSKVYFRCRHMVLLIRYFQFGSTVRVPKYGSYLVEMVVFLFPRIVDLHNFEIVLNELPAEDCAALYTRIGWLNIFNPCKVDGGYELQLKQRDERIVIKMLVTLSVEEPCQNIMEQQFQWERSDPHVPGWDLTEGWKTAEGVPARGLLSFHFSSYADKDKNTFVSSGVDPVALLNNTVSATPPSSAVTVAKSVKGMSFDDAANENGVGFSEKQQTFVARTSFKNSKRTYRVNNELRRCLTFACLVDNDASLKCETVKETRLAMITSKKGSDIYESAKARKSLWYYLYTPPTS